MKRNKHEEKKHEILESAFDIWGAERYQNTSLSELAASLDITKQALYRYFSSKEKLEQSMEELAQEHYKKISAEQLERLSELKGNDFVRYYVEENLIFIQECGKYLGFLAYRYRNDLEEPEITKEYIDSIYKLAEKNAEIPATGIRYLNSFIVHSSHIKETSHINKDWETAWKYGFASENIDRLPDFNRLLSDASTIDFNIFKADPLMAAVFDAVIEEAGNDVSLGIIAKKAGLTKSSLYNYWPSKEAMLTEVLVRQISVFSELYTDFEKKYTDPANRLFSYIAFNGSVFRQSPKIIKYLQRVLSYGIQLPSEKKTMQEQFSRPLEAIRNEGLLNLQGYTAEELLDLVNLASVIEMKHHMTEGSVRIRIDQGLKDLYRLISGGISALRRTI